MESIRKGLAGWIDTGVIADVLFEDLIRRGLKSSDITLENAKKLWLAALEDLPSMIDSVPTDRILKEAGSAR
jgi:hypothetical protein